jgi:hypothetical protein
MIIISCLLCHGESRAIFFLSEDQSTAFFLSETKRGLGFKLDLFDQIHHFASVPIGSQLLSTHHDQQPIAARYDSIKHIFRYTLGSIGTAPFNSDGVPTKMLHLWRKYAVVKHPRGVT